MSYKFFFYHTLYKKLKKANFKPLDVLVIGVTGAGKSTTLNTIFNDSITKVGTGVNPETMMTKPYRLNDMIRFWDTPGLGDGIEADHLHSKKIVDLLFKEYEMDQEKYGFIDLVLLVIEGSNRDMGTTYKIINEILLPNIEPSRILVVINQADIAMKGRHWIKDINKPDTVLEDFLENQATSIQKRILEATGIEIAKPIYYSAEYDYNINSLLKFIVENITTKRSKNSFIQSNILKTFRNTNFWGF